MTAASVVYTSSPSIPSVKSGFWFLPTITSAQVVWAHYVDFFLLLRFS